MSRDVTTDPDDQLTSIIKLIDNFSFVIDKNKMLYKIEDKPLFFKQNTPYQRLGSLVKRQIKIRNLI